jgi:DNA-binding response OmpR family regulator
MSTAFKARILVAEVEEFALNHLRKILAAANIQVATFANVATANAKICSFDPNGVSKDLNYGITAPSGADILHYLKK